VQGTGEEATFSRSQLDRLLKLGKVAWTRSRRRKRRRWERSGLCENHLVPTLRVGTHVQTLRVEDVLVGGLTVAPSKRRDAERPTCVPHAGAWERDAASNHLAPFFLLVYSARIFAGFSLNASRQPLQQT